jgi:hypothetical protein
MLIMMLIPWCFILKNDNNNNVSISAWLIMIILFLGSTEGMYVWNILYQ